MCSLNFDHYMRTETTGKSLNLVSYVCTYGNTITGCRIRMPDPHTGCRVPDPHIWKRGFIQRPWDKLPAEPMNNLSSHSGDLKDSVLSQPSEWKCNNVFM